MTITFEGKTYTLTQDAYYFENREYTAKAVDADGREFQVYWTITNPDYDESEWEDDACDWDTPSRVEALDGEPKMRDED